MQSRMYETTFTLAARDVDFTGRLRPSAIFMRMQEDGDNDALRHLLKLADISPESGEVELDFAKISSERLRRMQEYANSYARRR